MKKARCWTPEKREVGVLLDTCAQINLIDPSGGLFEWREDHVMDSRGAGGDFRLDKKGVIDLVDEDGNVCRVEGYAADLPGSAEVLLGNHSLAALGLKLGPPHDVEDGAPIEAWPPLDLSRAPDPDPESAETVETRDGTYILWSEAKMREWLDDNPLEVGPAKEYTFRDVDVNPDMSPELATKVWMSLEEFKSVFASGKYPVANEAYRREFGEVNVEDFLEPNAKPFHCKPPTMGLATKRFLNALKNDLEKAGILIYNPGSPWAMFTVIVTKGDGTPRVCFDLRMLNRHMKPFRPEINNGREQVEKISVPMRRFGSDGLSAFWQYPITKKSYNFFTFWFPVETSPDNFEFRKYSFTRVPFGWSGAPGVLTEHMEHLYQQMPPEVKETTATFFDDWSGGARLDGPDPDSQFVHNLREWLKVMKENEFVLKAPKTPVGYLTTKFYGFNIWEDGRNSLLTKYTEALDNLVEPKGASETRSLLGVLEIARNFVPEYALVVRPLVENTKKNVDFDWNDDCRAATEALRLALKEDVRRSKFNPKYPLHLATDASDVGWGAHLFQLVPFDESRTAASGGGVMTDDATAVTTEGGATKTDGVDYGKLTSAATGKRLVRYDKFGVESADGEFGLQTLAFFSKAWDTNMRSRPVFYREASALLGALAKCSLYAKSSRFPVQLYTDHVSLTWVKHNHKGAVTSFLLDELEDVPFEVHYRAGSSKIIKPADALSRYPLIGPQRWSAPGLESFYHLLRAECGKAIAAATKVWVYAASQDTRLLKLLVKEDAVGSRIMEASPTSGNHWPRADFAVLAPAPDKAPGVCAQFLREDRTGACLVPSDLMNRVPDNMDGSTDKKVLGRLDKARFVTSISSGFTWVVTGVPAAKHSVVMLDEAKGPAEAADSTDDDCGRVHTEKWIGRQDFKVAKSASIYTDEKGLKYLWDTDGLLKLLVPEQERAKLVRMAHLELAHLGATKTLAELRQRFYWPGMRAQVVLELTKCEACNRTRRARVLAHKNFRGVSYRGPRMFYSIDTKSFGGGHCLGVVDAFDGYVILLPLNNKSSAAIEDALLSDVFLVYGFPAEMRSDSAKEFAGLEEKLQRWNVKLTQTQGYHGQGNPFVERMWDPLKRYFKSSTTMVEWRRQLRMAAFALNVARRQESDLSAFEVQFGLPAVTSLQAATLSGTEEHAGTPEEFKILEELFRRNIDRCATAGDKYRRERAAALNRRGKGSKPVQFQLGSLVMTYREPTNQKHAFFYKPADFVPKWVGPWRVVDREATVYTLMGIIDGDGVELGKICRRTVAQLQAYNGEIDGGPPVSVEIALPEELAWSPGQKVEFWWGSKKFEVTPPSGVKLGGAFVCDVLFPDGCAQIPTTSPSKPVHAKAAAKTTKPAEAPAKTTKPTKGSAGSPSPRRRSQRRRRRPKRYSQ